MAVYHWHKIPRHLSGFRHPVFPILPQLLFKLRLNDFFVKLIVSAAVSSYVYTLTTLTYFSRFSIHVTLFSHFNHITCFN